MVGNANPTTKGKRLRERISLAVEYCNNQAPLSKFSADTQEFNASKVCVIAAIAPKS